MIEERRARPRAVPLFVVNNSKTTVDNGSLGSRVDEERSELRKLVRFASIVNHRVLERNLHRVGLPHGLPV